MTVNSAVHAPPAVLEGENARCIEHDLHDCYVFEKKMIHESHCVERTAHILHTSCVSPAVMTPSMRSFVVCTFGETMDTYEAIKKMSAQQGARLAAGQLVHQCRLARVRQPNDRHCIGEKQVLISRMDMEL